MENNTNLKMGQGLLETLEDIGTQQYYKPLTMEEFKRIYESMGFSVSNGIISSKGEIKYIEDDE